MRSAAFIVSMIVLGAAAESVTPIQKVISMLSDMQAKGKQEMQDEEVRYSSYKTFCENTSADKTKTIAKEESQLVQLAADIQQADADAMAAAKAIAGLDADINTWES